MAREYLRPNAGNDQGNPERRRSHCSSSLDHEHLWAVSLHQPIPRRTTVIATLNGACCEERA
jgi:hypothetical protein